MGSGSCLWGNEAICRAAAPVANGDEGDLLGNDSRIVNVSDGKERQSGSECHDHQSTTQDAAAAPSGTGEESWLVVSIFSDIGGGGIFFFIIVQGTILLRSGVRGSPRFTKPTAKPANRSVAFSGRGTGL